jgi:plasmid maintenance system antidote protein VapI
VTNLYIKIGAQTRRRRSILNDKVVCTLTHAIKIRRVVEVNLQAFLNLCEDERLASRSATFTSKIHRMGRWVVSNKCREEKPVAKLRTGLSVYCKHYPARLQMSI